jgi:hypothetical protein
MFERHLTDDTLILLVGSQLADSSRQAATDHLQQCKACQRRYKETHDVHAAWVTVAEYGLANVLSAQSRRRIKTAKTGIRFPWVPVSAIVTCSLVIILFVSLPKVVPEAKASELLSHAMQSEGNLDTLRPFEISVQGTACSVGRADDKLVVVRSSTLCTQATTLIERTPWRRRALSARTFHDWRDSLSERHDRVTRQATSWIIDTVTPMGIVREASLALGLTDYHPLSLQLKFDNQQEITISEDMHSFFLAKSADIKDTSPSRDIGNPADVLEVYSWELLQKLNADSGWEASVVRDGGNVVVKVDVENEARKREIVNAFDAYPEVTLDFADHRTRLGQTTFLANRDMDGDSAPQAQDWLREQFPDSESRNRFANSTLALSKVVLGRAFILKEMEGRRRNMQHCSCLPELSRLIRRETELLDVAMTNLGLAAGALLRSPSPKRLSSGSMSYVDAQYLDMALAHLLVASSSKNALSYQENIEIVRRLL